MPGNEINGERDRADVNCHKLPENGINGDAAAVLMLLLHLQHLLRLRLPLLMLPLLMLPLLMLPLQVGQPPRKLVCVSKYVLLRRCCKGGRE